LTAVTVLAFQPVLGCDFVNYDDGDYVKDNPHVQGAFSAANLTWAWMTAHAANWHPLTWLSLMLDTQLFGKGAWGYHLTNLLLHLANTLLLFGLLRRLTGATWRSALVAALFAVHPLHVESVAWVSERKDVLSTLFGFLTLWAYARYAEAPGLGRYLLVVLGLALSLLAKPMLVTLPFVLLLLDYWPLRRWRPAAAASDDGTPPQPAIPVGRLLLEKLPLLVLSAASSAVTVWAQQHGRAFQELADLPLPARLSNALVSYVDYLRQTIWPSDLAVLYPHPGANLPAWQVAGAAFLVLAVTALALWGGRRWPYLLVGWLWYVGTLVPVLGLVQVGLQARADRYTYVPLIGIFLLLSWGLTDLARRWRCREVLACAAGLALICFMAITWAQARYWNDSVTLWHHTLEVTEGNYVAHNNLGEILTEQGKAAESSQHFREALRIRPDCPEAHNNLGIALVNQGEAAEAIRHLREAVRLKPTDSEAHNNLGIALVNQGEAAEATRHFREAVRLKPGNTSAHNNLGGILLNQGQTTEAARYFRESLRLKPDNPQAHNNLGIALYRQGKRAEAIQHFREAVRLSPEFRQATHNLRIALLDKDQQSE
jgi:Flp pilus assembly protein TadD